MWQRLPDRGHCAWPVHDFARPAGIVEAEVDAWSGMRPTQFTTETRDARCSSTAPCPARTTPRSACRSSPTRPAGEDDPEPLVVGRGLRRHARDARLPGARGRRGRPSRLAGGQPGLDRARQTGPGHGRRTRSGREDARRATSSTTATTPYGRSWGAPFPPTESCTSAPLPFAVVSPSPSLSTVSRPSRRASSRRRHRPTSRPPRAADRAATANRPPPPTDTADDEPPPPSRRQPRPTARPRSGSDPLASRSARRPTRAAGRGAPS